MRLRPDDADTSVRERQTTSHPSKQNSMCMSVFTFMLVFICMFVCICFVCQVFLQQWLLRPDMLRYHHLGAGGHRLACLFERDYRCSGDRNRRLHVSCAHTRANCHTHCHFLHWRACTHPFTHSLTLRCAVFSCGVGSRVSG